MKLRLECADRAGCEWGENRRMPRANRPEICGVSFYGFDVINLGRRRLSCCSAGEWPGHAEEGSNYRRQ